MKDPNQVFTLLEAVFQAFDHIAKKRGIYKVETIGDCYVGAFSGLKELDFTSPCLTRFSCSAVCGVPTPNTEHAVQMARFATTALKRFDEVVNKLQLRLGPDTVGTLPRTMLRRGPPQGSSNPVETFPLC
jgi:class 3 adenylate cyclase